MNVFLINLEDDKERLIRADRQLRAQGIAYERIEAVNGRELDATAKQKSVNGFGWWCAIGRPVRDGEIGCALSHYLVYEKMIRENLPFCCVFEDDLVLSKGIYSALKEIEGFLNPKLPQVVLLTNYSKDSGMGICRSTGDLYAVAYVITQKAAVQLLRANLPLSVPCDHWRRWVRQKIIELYHYFPSVAMQNTTDFTSRTNDRRAPCVSDFSLRLFLGHKFKRLIGKMIDYLLLIGARIKGRRNKCEQEDCVLIHELTH